MIQDFLSHLAEQGIIVQLAQGELKVKGLQSRIAPFLDQIRARKSEIVEHLTKPTQQDQGDSVPDADKVREYIYPDGRVIRLTEEEFQELVQLFKILHEWKYGQFIP